MIIEKSWLGLANTQDEVHTFFGSQDQREWLLTFGLGIIILQGVSSRKSLAGVNMHVFTVVYLCTYLCVQTVFVDGGKWLYGSRMVLWVFVKIKKYVHVATLLVHQFWLVHKGMLYQIIGAQGNRCTVHVVYLYVGRSVKCKIKVHFGAKLLRQLPDFRVW
jgi:hypothetical protein